MKTDELIQRAEELSAITDPTPEQVSEMDTIASQLETSHAETVQKERSEESRRRLASAAQMVKKESRSVPAANRPDSAYMVSGARTMPEANDLVSQIVAPVITRPNYSVREIKESTYQNFRKIGYSDDAISIASSDAYARQVADYFKSGGKLLGELVTKAMTAAGEGEVLIPIQWQELITQPTMMTMLRGACRNINVGTMTNRYPRILSNDDRYSSHVRVTWGGETPSSLPDQGSAIQTDMIDIKPHEVYASGDFSISMFEDNAYGMQSMVPELMSDALDVDFDYRIIRGAGDADDEPWGLTEKVTGTRVVPEIETTTRGQLVYKDLVKTKKRVHQRFRANGMWLFNSNTWEVLASMVDDNNRPLFDEQQTAGMTSMPGGGQTWMDGRLLNRPYIISENMPDIGDLDDDDEELPFIYYANWEKLYYIVNRVGSTVKVLDQVKYQQGLYVYVLRARAGGRVVQPKAGAGLKNKAA